MNTLYRLTADVRFPEGAAPGAGGDANMKLLESDGRGNPVLRGSAFAGLLRHAWADLKGLDPDDGAVAQWFGFAADDENRQDSRLKVSDACFDGLEPGRRTHNLINRHTGAVAKKALFSLEAVPPGAKARVNLVLDDGGDKAGGEIFIKEIAGLLSYGLLAGGSSNRGIGRLVPDGPCSWERYDMGDREDLARYLDHTYLERKTGEVPEGKPLEEDFAAPKRLSVDLVLGIPRGQDLLVGDGQAGDYMLAPQSVVFADGTEHWRIPGSSLRGVFRSWMTRLAARDIARAKKKEKDLTEKVRDNVDRYYDLTDDDPDKYNPHLAGLGFVSDIETRKVFQESPEKLDDPILDLFGSMYKKGRIHITDAYSGKADSGRDARDRMHVAVDRISGGAHEGALFQTQVLAGAHLSFSGTVIVDAPTKRETQWLAKTLKALHLGILHVGSSKAVGRLEIREISARGPWAENVNELTQEVDSNGRI